jgi:uncharacterized membrane protein YkvA (DUF1232 family)
MNPMKRWFRSSKEWARRIKRDVLALWIAARDPRTPPLAKLVAGAVAAYALSPIDLIPDFVPVLGYVDDLLIVPIGIILAIKLVPAPLMSEFRDLAATRKGQPVSSSGTIFIVAIWLLAIIGLLWFFLA